MVKQANQVNQSNKGEAPNNLQSSMLEDKASSASAAADKNDATVLLSADHRKVEQLFQQYSIKKSSSNTDEKRQLVKQICTELSVHTLLEEQIFYPACREKGVEDDMLDEAQVEHDGAKIMISELMNGSPDDDFFDAKVKVLEEYIKHHVKEEEKESTGIFAKAKQAGVDMKSLAEQIHTRKPGLLQSMEDGAFKAPQTRSFKSRSFNSQPQQENRMNRQSNERERNSRGQFESGDRYQSAGRYRSQYQDEEGSGSGRGWHGDPEGHSRASEEGWEHRGGGRGGYSSRSEREDYDDRGSSGRGHGGWFGDPEGHSRASEEGWEHRGGGRGGYSSRSDREDYDDRGSSGRGHGGWFGDPEGHSRASEEGWQHRGGGRGGYSSRSDREDYNDDRQSYRSSGSGEGRGWHGDPEGHSRAAEEGWEHRGGSRGGGNGGRGRSEGRGHGGWFGDSEGHSEAARQRGR